MSRTIVLQSKRARVKARARAPISLRSLGGGENTKECPLLAYQHHLPDKAGQYVDAELLLVFHR